MIWLESLLRPIDRLTAIALGAILVAITLILFVNAMARYFAGIAIIGGEELARCLMVWMTFLGSYLLVRTRRHIAIDFLSAGLKPKARRWLEFAIGLLGMAVCSYFAVLGLQLTVRIFASGQTMSSLPLARAWFYLSVPVGMSLMAVGFLQSVLAGLTGVAQPTEDDFGLPAPTGSASASEDPTPIANTAERA